jgi:hypothetical protein
MFFFITEKYVFNPYIYFFVKSFENRDYSYKLQYYGGLELLLKFNRD